MSADLLLPSSSLAVDDLARAVSRALVEVVALEAERRRLDVLRHSWEGGHRRRFDDLLALLDRHHADLVVALDAARVALRRSADEAAR